MKIIAISSGSCGNAYIVRTSKHVLLLEAGVRYSKIMNALEYKFPDVVLCSHEHGDHSKSITDIVMKGTPIVCSNGTADALSICDWQREKPSLFDITILDAVHDAAQPSMFVIDDKRKKERLFFVTDTEVIPHTVDGITHLMIEVNWSKFTANEECKHLDRTKKTHLSLEEVVEWLEKQGLSKLQEVHLLHLSDDNSDEKFFKDTIAGTVGVPVFVH